MRAVGFKEFGDPEVLEVMDIPEVSAGPGEIRIKNYASAVNPTDIVSRSGLISQFRKDFPLPSVPGMDISGIVDQVGEGVETDISIGDKVMGMVIPNELHGAYREQITLNQFAVVKAPEGYSFAESSTLPMNGLTARLSLDLLNLNKGQVVAVTGGPGAYGGYVIQLAKADGLTVIADSNENDIELLNELGVDIYSTGGTQAFIEDQGVAVNRVEDLTSYPSILGGRVKTLHPKVFGGILSRRENDSDVAQLEEFEIPEIDLVIVDLYPFEETVASGASEQDIIEKIDIGGPAMLRAASKNHDFLTVLCDPADYGAVADCVTNNGGTDLAQRRQLAAKCFARTAAYDSAISSCMAPSLG